MAVEDAPTRVRADHAEDTVPEVAEASVPASAKASGTAQTPRAVSQKVPASHSESVEQLAVSSVQPGALANVAASTSGVTAALSAWTGMNPLTVIRVMVHRLRRRPLPRGGSVESPPRGRMRRRDTHSSQWSASPS